MCKKYDDFLENIGKCTNFAADYKLLKEHEKNNALFVVGFCVDNVGTGDRSYWCKGCQSGGGQYPRQYSKSYDGQTCAWFEQGG